MQDQSFRAELDRLRGGDALELETVVVNGKKYTFRRLVMRKGIFIFEEIESISNGEITYIEVKPRRGEALNALRMYVERNKSRSKKGGAG